MQLFKFMIHDIPRIISKVLILYLEGIKLGI